jgi:hypothetical protein
MRAKQKEHKKGINRRGTYLYCGCIWITIRPVWLVVGGYSQACTMGSGPAVTVRQWGVAGDATAVCRNFSICSLNFLCDKFLVCAECFPGGHIRVEY